MKRAMMIPVGVKREPQEPKQELQQPEPQPEKQTAKVARTETHVWRPSRLMMTLALSP